MEKEYPICPLCGCFVINPDDGETIYCNRRCHQWFDEWWAFVDLHEPLDFSPLIPGNTRELILNDIWEKPHLYYALRKLGAIFPARKLTLVKSAA